MVKLIYGKQFLRLAKKIPKSRQERLSELLKLFQTNPFDSRLHTKTLSGKFSGLYSFRITRDWRVVFQFISSYEVQLIELGNRKDIYK